MSPTHSAFGQLRVVPEHRLARSLPTRQQLAGRTAPKTNLGMGTDPEGGACGGGGGPMGVSVAIGAHSLEITLSEVTLVRTNTSLELTRELNSSMHGSTADAATSASAAAVDTGTAPSLRRKQSKETFSLARASARIHTLVWTAAQVGTRSIDRPMQ